MFIANFNTHYLQILRKTFLLRFVVARALVLHWLIKLMGNVLVAFDSARQNISLALPLEEGVAKGNERRQGKVKNAEKAEFITINEHIETIFNAELSSAVVLRQPLEDIRGGNKKQFVFLLGVI